LIQWFDTEEELEDLYYLAIRLGIENKTEELGIRLLKESFDSYQSGRKSMGRLL
jgi:LacI family transcriptional regulator